MYYKKFKNKSISPPYQTFPTYRTKETTVVPLPKVEPAGDSAASGGLGRQEEQRGQGAAGTRCADLSHLMPKTLP